MRTFESHTSFEVLYMNQYDFYASRDIPMIGMEVEFELHLVGMSFGAAVSIGRKNARDFFLNEKEEMDLREKFLVEGNPKTFTNMRLVKMDKRNRYWVVA